MGHGPWAMGHGTWAMGHGARDKGRGSKNVHDAYNCSKSLGTLSTRLGVGRRGIPQRRPQSVKNPSHVSCCLKQPDGVFHLTHPKTPRQFDLSLQLGLGAHCDSDEARVCRSRPAVVTLRNVRRNRHGRLSNVRRKSEHLRLREALCESVTPLGQLHGELPGVEIAVGPDWRHSFPLAPCPMPLVPCPYSYSSASTSDPRTADSAGQSAATNAAPSISGTSRAAIDQGNWYGSAMPVMSRWLISST
jgi:hypothetical protein